MFEEHELVRDRIAPDKVYRYSATMDINMETDFVTGIFLQSRLLIAEMFHNRFSLSFSPLSILYKRAKKEINSDISIQIY